MLLRDLQHLLRARFNSRATATVRGSADEGGRIGILGQMYHLQRRQDFAPLVTMEVLPDITWVALARTNATPHGGRTYHYTNRGRLRKRTLLTPTPYPEDHDATWIGLDAEFRLWIAVLEQPYPAGYRVMRYTFEGQREFSTTFSARTPAGAEYTGSGPPLCVGSTGEAFVLSSALNPDPLPHGLASYRSVRYYVDHFSTSGNYVASYLVPTDDWIRSEFRLGQWITVESLQTTRMYGCDGVVPVAGRNSVYIIAPQRYDWSDYGPTVIAHYLVFYRLDLETMTWSGPVRIPNVAFPHTTPPTQWWSYRPIELSWSHPGINRTDAGRDATAVLWHWPNSDIYSDWRVVVVEMHPDLSYLIGGSMNDAAAAPLFLAGLSAIDSRVLTYWYRNAALHIRQYDWLTDQWSTVAVSEESLSLPEGDFVFFPQPPPGSNVMRAPMHGLGRPK